MRKPKRKHDELSFELERIRKAKRLLRRGLRALEEIERDWLRTRARRGNPGASAEEREAAAELYARAAEGPDPDDLRESREEARRDAELDAFDEALEYDRTRALETWPVDE